MRAQEFINEEKVRLDPKCWKGKKIGNPKTKVKGGVRVNNCVPAESVTEMDGDSAGRDGSNRKRIGSYGTRDRDIPGPDVHLGPEHALTKKQATKKMGDVLDKEFEKSHKKGVAESANERKQNALWAQITDYEKRAKASKNDIKKAHYEKMANELRGKLKTSDNLEEGFSDMMAKERKKRLAAAEKKKQERRANTGDPAPQHYRDELAQAAKKYKKGVAEGEVVAFPKKHRGDLDSVDSCVKCGGDLQGGTYMGHKVKVCIPCKQVYLPPNSGIDSKGNKIEK